MIFDMTFPRRLGLPPERKNGALQRAFANASHGEESVALSKLLSTTDRDATSRLTLPHTALASRSARSARAPSGVSFGSYGKHQLN